MRGSGHLVATVASVLAAGYLCAALVVPLVLPLIAAGAAVAACALVLTQRRQPYLVRAILAIALWLGVGFAGAWVLGEKSLTGLAWVLIVLFAAPLPVIPWIYARTFSTIESPPSDEERCSS